MLYQAKVAGPPTSGLEVVEARRWVLRAVLRRAEQRLDIRIVVAHPRAGVGRCESQPVHHRQHRRGLHRRAVIAMADGLALEGVDAFGQSRSFQQFGGVVRAVGVVNLEAHDLAAIRIQDHVQVEPLSNHPAGKVGQIPAPELPRRRSHMRAGWAANVGVPSPGPGGGPGRAPSERG